jgi:hypothetical protein
VSDEHPWDRLSERTKDVYRILGSHNEKDIRKIKNRDIRRAERESRFSGYAENNKNSYEILQYEQVLRNRRRNFVISVCGIVVTVVGVIVAVLRKQN